MEDLVIITNSKGIEYEVTRERAERAVKNGDIKYSDIREITVQASEIAETAEPAETIENPELEGLRAKYLEQFGKPISARYKNDIEYIKSKLN